MSDSPSKFPEAYPLWSDYEWCASDAAGQVAVFTTAGIGPMPASVLDALPLTDSAMEALWSLPVRGAATMLVSLPRPDDFLHFASRGLFAYDWWDVHRIRDFSGRYELLAQPVSPIYLSVLPERFQSLLRSTALVGVRFAECRSLDVREFFRCEPAA